MIVFAAVSALSVCFAEADAARSPKDILEEVNARIEREFISADGLMLDYVGEIPTPEEIADLKPNAMGWWTPIENGSMFTGEWLPSLMAEGEVRKPLVERCVNGLLKMSEVSDVPGFIARGTGTDGVSHHPCGSNDQTDPWFFGLIEYCRWQYADPKLKARVMDRLVFVAKALESNQWGVPCDGAFKGENRGNLMAKSMPFWGKSRLMYTLKFLSILTGDGHWEDVYQSVKAGALDAIESGGEVDVKVFKTCYTSGVWIYVSSVQALARLVSLEENESDRARMKKGLLLFASRVAPLMRRRVDYDNTFERPFKYANWRTGYKWRPQKTQKDAESVAYSGNVEILGKRRAYERQQMSVPLAAAAICALSDRERYREEILLTLRHYDYATPNLSEFFHAAIAASSLWRAASVVDVGGVPRFAVDGRPMSATAVMPSPAGKPGEAVGRLREFRKAGVMVSSDVWTMHNKRYNPRQWWLGEGEYDFELFDAMARGLVDASPDGFIFPRIKIDPPAKWSAEHPDEMLDELSPLPESRAWRALCRRMFKDVIDHVERSPYAANVIGYHLGAFCSGEWIAADWRKPYVRAHVTPVSEIPTCKDPRDPLPPFSQIAARRAAISQRAEAVADMLIDVASYVKELTNGRKLVGAFFGYSTPPHEKLSKVLRSGKVDFFAAPPEYNEVREIGHSGRSQSDCQASYRLHGRVFFEESDFRTFLSRPEFSPETGYFRTRRRPLGESVAIIRRSIGKSLAGGWENWWFLLGGNDTFSAPEMMESIRIGAEEARRTLETAKWQPAEVAVFTAADEYMTSGATHVWHFRKRCVGDLHENELPTCGVPFDSYELADIADPRLPEYKVYLFPNAFTLSDEMRAKIKERVRRPGKTAIWVYAPGYYGSGEGSVADVVDMTGVPVEERALDESQPCRRMFAPTGDAVCARDGWRSVFMPMPPNAAELRKAFREAGAHVWMETGDVFAAGRGYVMVHAASDDEKRISLPSPCGAHEIFGASPDVANATVLAERMKLGETRVWRIE
ncbi:MAG: hypothetical protein IJG84_23580 [Kiritimatiellae bacterium]|nr:hypothetical protein [Kiritimatiellia bacterium]